MRIRRAEDKDIPKVLDLLSQVLEIHAGIRPDIFIPGTTKYTEPELVAMFRNDSTPVYVATNEEDEVIGYAFCQIREQPFSTTMVPFSSLFIDDFCVDGSVRGQHVGKRLFEHLKEQARSLGCHEISLNVWEGNTGALRFYQAMGFRAKETQMEFIIK